MKRLLLILIGGFVAIFILFAGLLFVYINNFDQVTLSGNAMYPTYEEGDTLIIRKTKNVIDGDVVVYESSGIRLVHRIVAKQGDTIEIKNGTVFVNGDAEEYENFDNIPETFGDIYLEENNQAEIQNGFFMLGDNRAQSFDSRRNGLVSQEDIIGKVLFSF